MSPVRLYIIEQHPLVCQALVRRLDAEPSIAVVGAACELCHGVDEAQRLAPDIVLLASNSNSREDTLATIQAICLLREGSAPGIILLAAYLDEREREQALAVGAQRYLLKDIDTPRLVREIELVSRARSVTT